MSGGLDLLGVTLEAAIRDGLTVTAAGAPADALLEGMSIHRARTHVDDRGSLVELFDPRWGWHPDPAITAYAFTVRPGRAKGWAMHKAHEDRYSNILGEAEVILYDVRPASTTCGRIARIRMSHFDRCSINIPPFVWHATRNLGTETVLMVNFPTVPYDYEAPDKYRLPLDTPLIPFSFEGMPGW